MAFIFFLKLNTAENTKVRTAAYRVIRVVWEIPLAALVNFFRAPVRLFKKHPADEGHCGGASEMEICQAIEDFEATYTGVNSGKYRLGQAPVIEIPSECPKVAETSSAPIDNESTSQ